MPSSIIGNSENDRILESRLSQLKTDKLTRKHFNIYMTKRFA